VQCLLELPLEQLELGTLVLHRRELLADQSP
jgi:hypothetical protein